MPAPRAALYIRVSREEQARHGFSIEGQRKALQQYCTMYQITLFREYIDAGRSGKNIRGRPQLQMLLHDARANLFDVVIIWRLDRLARNLIDVLEMVKIFDTHNIAYHSLNEYIDSSKLGRTFLQVHASIAEWQLGQIAENIRISALTRSKGGVWNAGNNVLGYRWIKDDVGRSGQIVLMPEEAEIVHSIFEMYATGLYGYKAVANRVNAQGLRTKQGKPFSIQSVRGILLNRNYIGEVKFTTSNGYSRSAPSWVKGQHPVIVEQPLWDQVQKIHAARSTPPQRKFERRLLLTGFLKCPQCGSSMVAGHVKRKRKTVPDQITYYYVCSNYNSKGSNVCKPNYLQADAVEEAFFQYLQPNFSSQETVDRITASVNSWQDSSDREPSANLHDMQMEMKRIMKEQKRLFEQFEDDMISPADLTRELKRLKQVQESLQTQLEEQNVLEASRHAQVMHKKMETEKIRHAIEQLQSVIRSGSFEQQRKLFGLLIDKIIVPLDRDISKLRVIGVSDEMRQDRVPLFDERDDAYC